MSSKSIGEIKALRAVRKAQEEARPMNRLLRSIRKLLCRMGYHRVSYYKNTFSWECLDCHEGVMFAHTGKVRIKGETFKRMRVRVMSKELS